MPTVPRSTAEVQRARVVDCAVRVFARTGYWATPVTEVAREAGISPAYVFRLFESKVGVFVAAVDRCYALMAHALADAADRETFTGPGQVLAAMSEAYADLVTDRDLLMLQVHAQSATAVPQVREAVQRGVGLLVTTVRERSEAEDVAVRDFFARGQLWNLVIAADIDDLHQSWARTLTVGLTHLGEDARRAPGPGASTLSGRRRPARTGSRRGSAPDGR